MKHVGLWEEAEVPKKPHALGEHAHKKDLNQFKLI